LVQYLTDKPLRLTILDVVLNKKKDEMYP
jgi:hypothetical protein